MKRPLIIFFLVLFILISPTVMSYAQATAQSSIKVEGEVLKPLMLTIEDLAKMKHQEVSTKDRDGKSHIYKGVLLVDILNAAGVTLGKELRGENLVKYVVIKAADGYEVVFSLAEVDRDISEHKIIVAYLVDGNTLPKGDGPFRIVAPNDKRQARWVRELQTIKVLFPRD